MVPVISLLALIFAIAFGVIKKVNIGLVAVILAGIVGYGLCGMSMKSIYVDGWPTQVFFQSIAVMMMFGVAQDNGTMKVLVNGMVAITRGNDKLLPIIMFVGSGILCALGAGVPFAPALLPIAFVIAINRKINPLLMCLVTACGIMAGGTSPLAIHGSTAQSLGLAAGVTNYTPIWLCVICTMTIYAIALYFIFKGHKIEKSSLRPEDPAVEKEKLNGKQIFTLCVIGLVILSALILKYDIGLMAFAGGALLLIFGCANEKKVIAALPWNIVIMIGGVSILVNVVNEAGGITLLADLLSNAVTERTGTAIMCILGGLLSAVSSSVGVVMPTLIPTAGELSTTLGISASWLVAGVVLGSNIVVVSPMSTIGAISMASIPEGADIDRNKFFTSLLIAAILFVVIAALLALLGFYNIILN